MPEYTSWTGPGYMKVMEGDAIEFSGISVDFPMYYDIVIRYDPRVSVYRYQIEPSKLTATNH